MAQERKEAEGWELPGLRGSEGVESESERLR